LRMAKSCCRPASARQRPASTSTPAAGVTPLASLTARISRPRIGPDGLEASAMEMAVTARKGLRHRLERRAGRPARHARHGWVCGARARALGEKIITKFISRTSPVDLAQAGDRRRPPAPAH
jgi:hypothetical protein